MTNWIQCDGGDLYKVLSSLIATKANEDSEGGIADKNNLDVDTLANRRDELVAAAVASVRAAIQNAVKCPLSVTTGTVPPEGEMHTLYIAAYELVCSTPNLGYAIITEKGEASPLQKLYVQACSWLESVRTGRVVTHPTDPTGQDYLTAISASNPAVSSIVWGDNRGNDADYAAGVFPNGTELKPESMNSF